MADKPYNALLIENDPDDAQQIRKLLAKAKSPSFQINLADSLNAALQQVKVIDIDIVLLDLSLLDIPGTKAVEKIHNIAPDVPVIVLAGIDDEKVAIKSMQKGAQDYLLKSKLDSNLLLSSMRSAIERKQIEQTLRLAQFSMDRASESILWIAPDAKFIYVNDAACRTLGYSKKELLRMTIHNIDPNYNPKDWPEHWKNLKRKGSIFIETQHRTKSGNLIPVEIVANYLKFGEKEYDCAFARDVSERKQAELALRMSEQRFRAIADYTYFWEVWVSPKGCVLWTNPAVERITGYSIEQLKQITDYPMLLVLEDDRETIAEAFESALNDSSGKALEFRLRRKDGSVIWADISWQPIYDEKGSSQGHRESIHDITERKRAEEEVRKSQQMLQSVLDTIPVGVFWKDRESVYLGCNQHFAKDASLNSPDEIVGKDDYELGWKQQTEFYRADDAYVVQTGKPKLSYEEPVIAPDGTQLWVRTSKVPLRDLNGNVIGILGTYEDISEQKRAEQTIRANEKRFRSVVETASDAIITADSSGEITFWNSAAEDMFGYSADEIIGKPLTAIMPKRYREAHIKGLNRLVATGQPRLGGKIAEFEALKKDGSEFPISLSIASWGIEEGMFFTTIVRDITDRKEAEKERERLMLALELKNEELESILYVASHDLRAPLVNIQGFSHELSRCCNLIHSAMAAEKQITMLDREAQNAFDEAVPQALKFILAGADKMDSLLSGLLRLSRLGQAALNIKPLDMNEMMAQVAAGMEFQIQQASVSVKIELLTPCMGDAAQVNQVFTNLLDNALKHLDETRPGVIHIYSKSDNNQSIYCVEDNGIGIIVSHQKKIFEIFHRLDPDKESGQGLGLTIVKRILDRHNGNVWVESEPGKGSKFFVALPKA